MYTFRRIAGRQWQGNGFGTSAAEHQLVSDGKPVDITLRGTGGGSYYLSVNGVRVGASVHTFARAKEAAIERYEAEKQTAE